ncbi:putative transcription factor B3-Domain family [Helianthus annuus]|uniref:Transcription factor B3-Domain family n=1 Tax=Helianthus annuus TaxID=4232 RepID=A0A9K3JHW3_HELAN|nr:putative transcription factor B3-Domain family [Helianthus annuus]KAJ0945003.1 putative transcription factor B3-Domain family [Helianthus annuus]
MVTGLRSLVIHRKMQSPGPLMGGPLKSKCSSLQATIFFYNGWFDVVSSLKLPDDSWVVCQYEEALSLFRIFHFCQDISLAPSNYFYYKPKNDLKDREDCMVVCSSLYSPSDPVLIRSAGNRKWVVKMEILDHNIYITTGWSRIKEEMSITDDHLLVFEMIDRKTFELSVFCCKPALLTYPPELSVIKKEPTDGVIEVSDDEVPDAVAGPVFEQSVDDEVPVTFVVDNHYKWAQTHGLDRKMDLIIKDSAGQTWDVAIGKEFSQGCPRFNVTGMREFVRDKRLVYGSSFQMVFVKSKGMLLYN